MHLFVQKKHDTPYQSGDSIIREWHCPKSVPRISWRGFIATEHLRFSPSIKQAALNGHFLLALPDVKAVGERKIIINRLGRVKTETT